MEDGANGQTNLTRKERRAFAREEKKKGRGKEATFNKLKKLFTMAFGVFVLLFLGYKALKWINTPQPEVAGSAVEVVDSDWIRGKKDAKVTLIEYSDFQCPACKQYQPILENLIDEYADNLKIVYRHYPLFTIHKNAIPSAKASEAAGNQGKFWEMHDMLFEKQDEWSEEGIPMDKFVGYAKDLGLNEESFKNDYQSKDVEDKVNQDLTNGNSLRLTGTPTFYINGRKIENPQGYEGLKKAVDNALKEN